MKTDISFNFITAAWTAVLTLIFTPIYVHYLGLEAYGLIGLLATLQVSLAVLNLGLGHVLARELARFTAVGISEQSARNLTHSVEAITLVVAIVIAVSIAAVADWIGQSWLRPGQTPIAGFIFAIGILGFLLALRLVEGVYQGAVTGLHKQVRLNLTTIFCVTLRAFGSLFILLFISRSVAVFFIWQAIVSALNVFLLRRIVYGSFGDRNLGTKFSLFELKKIARFAAGITSMSVLGVALTQTDKLLLSKLLLLNEYGEYMLAVTLAAAPLTLAGPISQATQPRFARAFAINNDAGLAQLFHASSQLLTVLVGSAAIVIACFSREVLTLWLHDPALAERLTGLVSILALGSLLNGLLVLPYVLQLAHGWTGLGARVNLVAVVILVPTLLLVVPKYGAVGAAWLWLVLNFGYFTISLHFMFRRILPEHKLRWYLSDVGQPLMAAVAVALILRPFFPADGGVVLRLAGLGVVSAVVLCGAAVSATIVREQIVAFVFGALRARQSSLR